MEYQPRVAEARLQGLLKLFPVVAITGPRQSGKTTLLKHLFPGYVYHSFDTPLQRSYFEDDPEAFIKSFAGPAILDEVQNVPAIFEWIKAEVDRDRSPGRFILTGSAQFSMVKGITESLAGRCGFLSLLPFQVAELPAGDWTDAELGGWYPELALRSWKDCREWFDAYTMTYLERDVRSMIDIGKIRDFQAVLGLLAARTAQELNLSQIARDAGVNEKTVGAWVSVLEASYLIFLLQPYHRNLGKRLVKRPKLYFWDTGLVSHLAGIRAKEHLAQGPMAGALFENAVIADLAKDIRHRGMDRRLFYFRANTGVEADFIIEDAHESRITFGEVKRRQSIRPDDVRHLRNLIASSAGTLDEPWSSGSLVVTTGQGVSHLPDGTELRSFGKEWLR